MNNSSFEDILAFSQIEKYLSSEEKDSLLRKMNTDLQTVNERLVGKRKEDEFLLILLFFDVLENITGFDEGISKIGNNTASSDFVLEMKNGMKFFLEIKHTKNIKFKISGGNLKRKIEYAKSLGMDLFFAISLNGVWMLFSSVYLEEKGGIITLSDWNYSQFDNLLETYSYIFPPGIEIRSIYSKKRDDGIGIFHKEYGELLSYELRYMGRKIIRVKGKNSSSKIYSIILEALNDRLSSRKRDVRQNDDVTVIVEYDNGEEGIDNSGYNIIPEYLFLLAPVYHTGFGEENERFDAIDIVNALKSDMDIPRISKEHVRGIINKLVNEGIPIRYLKNGKIYRVLT